MKLQSRQLDTWLPPCAALILLALGAGLAGQWAYGLAGLALVVVAWLARRFKWDWGANALLLAYLALAANGLLQGYSPALMIAGATAALVAWELSERIPPGDQVLAALFRRRRLRALLASAALGLALAEAGLFLRLQLPFFAVFLAALVALFCLYRLFSFRAGGK